METDKLFYRWGKVKDGTPASAIVHIEVLPNASNTNGFIELYCGKGFYSQGSLEEVPEFGYDSWRIAARKGLEYAFSLTQTCWTVKIFKIQGRVFTDTNPTIVGYTVIRTFCDQAKIILQENTITELEQFVFSSWKSPYKELIPDFFNLTFSDFTNC